ncbi:agglutinin-like isoform X2 [Lycium barbarum]|uniref:agglutinin-like isoform X2 n=1 Tax=Lycium barbarum TaxID=112863 RepID=UPI00293EC36E|nr:agglutinin-like isoform X2 [Lycium barbarum]
MGNQVSYDQADSILAEPWGGTGGSQWNYKFKSPIKEILIGHGVIVDSIMFRAVNEKGTIDSPRFGGSGGRKDKVIIEAAPLEYLTGIKGTFGNYGGHLVIRSLNFITNAKKYGPFGTESGGNPFSLVMKEGGAIVGFHGRSGLYLDAIGVYLQKLTPPTSPNEPEKKIEPNEPEKKFEPNEPMVEEIEIHDKMDVMKTIVPRSAGPWGGYSGKGWDDGVFCTIKQVQVHMNLYSSAISGIQIEYEKELDKTSFWSQLHGGVGAGTDTIRKINIDGENEFLIGIEGFYSPVNDNGGLDAIRQIAFYTNKRKYGPYGAEIGTYFSSSAARGKIAGFHGRSGVYLNAIGVHMEYF